MCYTSPYTVLVMTRDVIITLCAQDGEKAGTDEKKKEDGEKPGSGIDGKDENMKKTCTPSMVCDNVYLHALSNYTST